MHRAFLPVWWHMAKHLAGIKWPQWPGCHHFSFYNQEGRSVCCWVHFITQLHLNATGLTFKVICSDYKHCCWVIQTFCNEIPTVTAGMLCVCVFKHTHKYIPIYTCIFKIMTLYLIAQEFHDTLNIFNNLFIWITCVAGARQVWKTERTGGIIYKCVERLGLGTEPHSPTSGAPGPKHLRHDPCCEGQEHTRVSNPWTPMWDVNMANQNLNHQDKRLPRGLNLKTTERSPFSSHLLLTAQAASSLALALASTGLQLGVTFQRMSPRSHGLRLF